MSHKLIWYSYDGKTANIIDYGIANRRLTGSIQDTSVYRSRVVDVKSKDHHVVVSRVNLSWNFGKVITFREAMALGDSIDENLRENLQEQWNTAMES